MRYQCDALDSNSIVAKGGIVSIALHKHQVRPSYCGLPACFLATLLFTVSQRQSFGELQSAASIPEKSTHSSDSADLAAYALIEV